MTFDEVLPALREGKRIRRAIWVERFPGGWLELITPAPLPDGRAFDRLPLFWNAEHEIFHTWVGSWDVIADDWEIL